MTLEVSDIYQIRSLTQAMVRFNICSITKVHVYYTKSNNPIISYLLLAFETNFSDADALWYPPCPCDCIVVSLSMRLLKLYNGA